MDHPKHKTVKEKIIECSVQAFHEFGVKETTIEYIVKQVGIAKGTFYYYFQSKNEIVETVVASDVDRLSEDIRNLVSNDIISPESTWKDVLIRIHHFAIKYIYPLDLDVQYHMIGLILQQVAPYLAAFIDTHSTLESTSRTHQYYVADLIICITIMDFNIMFEEEDLVPLVKSYIYIIELVLDISFSPNERDEIMQEITKQSNDGLINYQM